MVTASIDVAMCLCCCLSFGYISQLKMFLLMWCAREWSTHTQFIFPMNEQKTKANRSKPSDKMQEILCVSVDCALCADDCFSSSSFFSSLRILIPILFSICIEDIDFFYVAHSFSSPASSLTFSVRIAWRKKNRFIGKKSWMRGWKTNMRRIYKSVRNNCLSSIKQNKTEEEKIHVVDSFFSSLANKLL